MWVAIALFAVFIVFLPDLVFAPIVALLWCFEQFFKGLTVLLSGWK